MSKVNRLLETSIWLSTCSKLSFRLLVHLRPVERFVNMSQAMTPSQPAFKLLTTLRHDPLLLQAAAATGTSSTWAHAGFNFQRASPLYMLPLHRDRLLRAARHFGWQGAVEALEGEQGLAKLEEAVLNAVKADGADGADGATGSDAGPPRAVRVLVDERGDMRLFVRRQGVEPVAALGALFPGRLPPPAGAAASGDEARRETDPPREPEWAVVLASGSESEPDAAVQGHQSVGASHVQRSEFTHFKTTERSAYDRARAAAGIGTAAAPAATDSPASVPAVVRKEVLIVEPASHDGDQDMVMECSVSTPYFWRGGRWVTPPVSKRGFSRVDGSGGQDGTTRRWALERQVPLSCRLHAFSQQTAADQLTHASFSAED